ncbi:proton-coupled amino acid transporter-like protein CG1139 [Ochlerotatus camptorhynchus]|uniref:proton-coupled amino acid transporter-like protein CG1139 n=1 Tax=Ochlerotatus camptorhynchus TaxID=644619 RepID=UPI0031CE0949
MAPNLRDLETALLLSAGAKRVDGDNYTTTTTTNNNNNERLKPSPLDAALHSNNTRFYGSTANQWQKLTRYDPLQQRKLENPTSNLDTLVHILNGNLGTGILAMPDAFKNAGLYVGLFGTMAMGIICTHSMHTLVKVSHELCRRYEVPSLSFSDVGQYALESGPSCFHRFGRLIGLLINCFLITMQIGFCCVYFLFVAINLTDFLEYISIKTDVFNVLVCILLPLIALNMIRSLKFLTPTSMVAAILAISGITISFMFLLSDLPRSTSVSPASDWRTIPLYFGTVMYAFEGIGVILPLENNMKTPKDFCRWNGVLNTGMTIVVCLYSAVGFYGYLKYGDAAQGSITLNLPSHLFLAELVRLLMAVAVFASYALQFYVPMTILGPVVRRQFGSNAAQDYAEYALRIALVLLTFTLAAIIPNLGSFISLVGAVSTSTLALVFPPLLEIATYWPNRQYGRWNWILWKDIAVVSLGLFGFLIGTSTSVVEIITEWE